MEMRKIILPIKGMHCRSCEILLEDKLAEVGNVRRCKLDYRKGLAEIYYIDSPRPDDLAAAVEAAGYQVGRSEKTAILTRNSKDYKELGIALVFFIAFYLIVKALGFSDIKLNSSINPSSLWVALLIGLVAGVSTCMALVGGLVLGLATRHAKKHPQADAIQKFRPHLFFNLGRVAGFAVFGGALGALGSIFHLSNGITAFLTLFVGAVMIIIGLQLIELSPRLSRWRLTLPKSLAGLLGINQRKEYSHGHSVVFGALTFFLPCGFTQAMQLYAISTGSFISGAMVMGAFALGTAPGLLSIGGITAAVKGRTAKYFFKFAGVVLIFFALLNLSGGYNLTGWRLDSKPTYADSGLKKDSNVTIADGKQTVKMTESYRGYYPQQFTIKKGLPVRWEINAQDPYSCASSLVAPKIGIRAHLKPGKNIIEFTPKETGLIPFSCSMGMYTGEFNVID